MFKQKNQQLKNNQAGLKHSGWLAMILLLSVYVLPVSAMTDWSGWESELNQAESDHSQIINNVSASASTGNNTAAGGEVVQGQSQSSVKVETIINGQTVEDIDIKQTSDSGQAEVKAESKTEVNDDTATVETATEINGQEQKETKTVDLNSGNSQQSAQGGSPSDQQAGVSGGTIVNSGQPSDNNDETATSSEESLDGSGQQDESLTAAGQAPEQAEETSNGQGAKFVLARLLSSIFNNFWAGLNRLWSWFS